MSLTNASTSAGVGRQAGQVEAQPAGQRAAVGLGGGLQAVLLQLRQDEAVDRVADPRLVLDRREARAASAAMSDQCGWYSAPAAIQRLSSVLLRGGQRLVRSAGGGITSSGSSELMRAISSLSSGLPGTIAPGLDGRLAAVEPQVGLARGAVGAVAGEAVLGQDRPDVAVVFQLPGGQELDPSSTGR